jgi:DNA mismatch repair protein MutH
MSQGIEPPASIDDLTQRVRLLAGRTLERVANDQGIETPEDQRRAKGWVGQLLETALGATAGSRAEPDFPHLGVEMKTLPVDARGVPRESTYVAVAPIDGSMATRWDECWVRRKLSRVLWVPIVGDAAVPLGQRRVGSALLWEPSHEDEARMRADWEELAELIHLGQSGEITAHQGEVLQIRPKAAHSRETTWVLDADAQWVEQNPRGWYLRKTFTTELVARHFALPHSAR